MNSNIIKKQKINYSTFGDNLVLDIFHIGYMDLTYTQPTSKYILIKVMCNTYANSEYSNSQIKNVIENLTSSKRWFQNRPGFGLHLNEMGVEFYMRMVQVYNAENRAKQADNKTKWIIVISVGTMWLTWLLLRHG